MKQMQLLCYKRTLKETKWQAVKSKGVVLVFRMFRLDRRLPKDLLRSRWGPLLYETVVGLRQEIARGECDITTSDIWWYVQEFGRKVGYHVVVSLVEYWAISKPYTEVEERTKAEGQTSDRR